MQKYNTKTAWLGYLRMTNLFYMLNKVYNSILNTDTKLLLKVIQTKNKLNTELGK
jgi:hypothetical protein